MPIATPQTLRTQIDSRALQPVYLLVGDDAHLLDTLSNAIADTIEDDLRAFNYERLYTTDKEVTADAVVEAARIAPMMAPRRVVAVLRAEKWLKPKRVAAEAQEDAEAPGETEPEAVEKGAMAPLLEYLKQPVPSTTLVFVASEVHKATPIVKALYKSATVVECRGLGAGDAQRGGDPRQALALIRQTAAASGRQVEPAAAQLLAARSGGDIVKLRADLDHVLLFVEGQRAVTRADIDAVVSDREGVRDPWALTNALERGQLAEALRLLAKALEDGAVPYMVLGQLAWFVRDKLPSIRPRAVSAAAEAVFRTDVDLKTSGGDPRVLLERLVLELCGPPKRPRR